jgi:RND family efflux transporter MFP subunit
MRKSLPMLLLSGIIAVVFVSNGCSFRSNADMETPVQIAVEVQQVKPVIESMEIRYSGTVREFNTIPVAFPVNGIVKKMNVKEGQEIRRGTVMATIDNSNFKNAFVIAEATYNRAVDAVSRLKPMHENGNLAAIDWVEAQTTLKQAEAALAVARKNLNDCKLIAPDNALVGHKNIEQGNGVLPGQTAITLVQIDSIYSVISVHENEIADFKYGDEALVTIPALGDATWKGIVREIGVIADPVSHTYRAKIAVDNNDKKIRPGMICNVVHEVQNQEVHLALPNSSIQVDEYGRAFVYKVDLSKNTATRFQVNTGKFLQNGVEIIDGLVEGEFVVTAGQHRLYENAPVLISNLESIQ